MSLSLSRFLTVISVIFIIFAVFSLWLSRDIYDTSNFAKLSTKALQKESVRNAIASETVDRVLQDKPIVRQVAGDYLQSFIAGMLDNPTMGKVLEKTSSRLHDYVLNDNRKDVLIDTGGITTAIKPIVNLVSPDLAKQLGDKVPSSIVIVSANSVPQINPWLGWVVATGPVLGIIGIVVIILVIVFEKNIGLSLKRIGLFLTVGSLIFMLVVPYFRMLLSSRVTNPNRTTVALATYDVFTKDLFIYLLWTVLFAILLFILGYFWPRIIFEIKKLQKQ